jgi:hypothetical protein
MKNRIKLAVLCAVLAMEAARAGAQNLVQNVTIALSGYVQGPSNDNGTNATQTAVGTLVATKTVIQTLGAALGTSFSSKAQLQFMLDTSGNLQSIVVSDGGQQTDVTTSFTITDGNYVSKSKSNDTTGAGSAIRYGIREFAFSTTSGLSFDVQGFTTIVASTVAATGGTTTTLVEFTATVAGTGTDANGNPLVLKGAISGTKD